jgi:hypothetical protein
VSIASSIARCSSRMRPRRRWRPQATRSRPESLNRLGPISS